MRNAPIFTVFETTSSIKQSFRNQEEKLRRVQTQHISKIEENEVNDIAEQLWDIIRSLEIGVGETKIVAGSKALHHLLPKLVPPIDGQYTLKFFYNNRGTALNQGGKTVFMEIYPRFVEIGSACESFFNTYLSEGMNTSETKIIDNAIVGFVRNEL
ncbi:MAG: hypothetical protein MAG715_00620 [Methanonatronarchaeales archaeon]|nr:hypothetical protein [Methanonatronarchaeales archaeon]